MRHHSTLQLDVKWSETTDHESQVHAQHDNQCTVVREWIEGFYSWRLDFPELRERLDLSARQEEIKADTVTAQDLPDEEATTPGHGGVVQQSSQPLESGAALLPVSRRAVLVNRHENGHAPCPAFKPMKKLGVGIVVSATEPIRNQVCQQYVRSNR